MVDLQASVLSTFVLQFHNLLLFSVKVFNLSLISSLATVNNVFLFSFFSPFCAFGHSIIANLDSISSNHSKNLGPLSSAGSHGNSVLQFDFIRSSFFTFTFGFFSVSLLITLIINESKTASLSRNEIISNYDLTIRNTCAISSSIN